MKPVYFAALPLLISSAAALGQVPSPQLTQDVVATTFCAKAGTLQLKGGVLRCNGSWTLTLQPAQGAAAHLVGEMSPAEVIAVLTATGIAYQASENGTLTVGKVELQFGERGLEAIGRQSATAATGT